MAEASSRPHCDPAKILFDASFYRINARGDAIREAASFRETAMDIFLHSTRVKSLFHLLEETTSMSAPYRLVLDIEIKRWLVSM